MLQKPTEFILPDCHPPRVCEACGQEFVCGASLKGCWCVSVKLDAAAREALRGQYKDCLCSVCLAGFAAHTAEQAADEH